MNFILSILTILLFASTGALLFFGNIFQSDFDDNEKKTEENHLSIDRRIKINVDLSMISKNMLDNFRIQESDKKIFEQYTSNEFCNHSSYVAIFLSRGNQLELCQKIINQFPDKGWKHLVVCKEAKREQRGRAPEFISIHEEAILKDKDGFFRFNAAFYPFESTYPFFLPVNYEEKAIIDHIKKTTFGFYYFYLEYSGKYDREKYSCNYDADINHRGYCECLTSTYKRTIFDGHEKEELRVSKSPFSWISVK